MLPANVHLRRPYKQRAAPRRRRRRAVQHGRGFKSFMRKGFNFAKRTAKKAYNNKSIRDIAKAIISEVPTAVEGLSNKVNNKTLKKILDNDITKTGINLAAGYALDKLQ